MEARPSSLGPGPEGDPMAKATSRGAIREALEVHVLAGLRPVTMGLVVLFAFFAASDWLLVEPPARDWVVLGDAAAGLVLAGLWAALRLGWVQSRHANVVALAGALAVLAAIVVSLVATADPLQSMGLPLLLLGASLFMLSWPALLTLAVLADAAWLAVALLHGAGPGWLEMATLLVASNALAAVAHAVRLRSLRRLEALRVQDHLQKARLARALAEAKESQERLRRVASATFEGICIHDGDSIVDANAPLAELVGLPADAVSGRPVLDLVGEADRDRVAAHLRQRAGEPFEAQLRHADGSTIPVEMRGRAVPATKGQAFVLAVRDLRPRRRAEEAARLAAERLGEIQVLRQVNEFKTHFINMASHELKTPMTPILLQMGLLRGTDPGADPTRFRRAVDVLLRNVQRLNKLVGDVLASARIQADRLQVKPRPTDVEALLRDAVESVREVAVQRGLQLDLDAEGPLWAQADPDRVHEVVLNLLTNAFKFTPAGGRIAVSGHPEAPGGPVVVTVADSGLGISAADIGRLFQPFSQVHDPSAVTEPGSGLGLHISRGIVERHGGRLWCESEGPGKGSRFSFTLPADPTAGLGGQPGVAPPSAPADWSLPSSRGRDAAPGAAGA